MKVVINKCYGGFGLSDAAMRLLAEKRGWEVIEYAEGEGFSFSGEVKSIVDPKGDKVWDYDLARIDPDLVAVVEELQDKANGFAAELNVVEIPDGTDYVLEEYDGREWIAERHETWG